MYKHHRYLVEVGHTLFVHRHSRPIHPLHKHNNLILQVHIKILPYIGVGWVMILSCLFFGALAQKTLTNISFFVKKYGTLSKYRVMTLRGHSCNYI